MDPGKTEVHVFDFDGSITVQKQLLEDIKNRLSVHNMRRYQYSARLWASSSCFAKLCQSVGYSKERRFSLIGSGDYHHVSLALISQYSTPLTVVIFDNHPDWMRPPHQYHCGTWVYSLARLPHVAQIIIVGLESGDIDSKHFRKGDMESFENGKILLFPFQPVTVNRYPATILKCQLKDNVGIGMDEILRSIPTEHVYISVDKDCLRTEDACTNWEQGTLPLSYVTSIIQHIGQHKTVLGGDTVGDYSPPTFRSPFKWIASYWDRRISPASKYPDAIDKNMRTNRLLIQAMEACHV